MPWGSGCGGRDALTLWNQGEPWTGVDGSIEWVCVVVKISWQWTIAFLMEAKGRWEGSKYVSARSRMRSEIIAEGLGRGTRFVNIDVGKNGRFQGLVEGAKTLVRTSAYRARVAHRCRPQQWNELMPSSIMFPQFRLSEPWCRVGHVGE